MRNLFLFAVMAMMLVVGSGCSVRTVPAGHVGVKVYLLGQSKGVDHEVVGVGRQFLGWNEELYLFPTFEQNYTWTKSPHEGSPNDESIDFQDKDATRINADVGISYHINPLKVADVFQKYRRGVEEITDTFIRNQVRDAINKVSSTMNLDEINGSGKMRLLEDARKLVNADTAPIGVEISKLYLVNNLRYPDNVTAAINLKIEATQRAIQRENELREAEAAARKKVAEAEGQARSILAVADAEAKANHMISASLTQQLVEYKKIDKWDGQLPLSSGGGAFVTIDTARAKAAGAKHSSQQSEE